MASFASYSRAVAEFDLPILPKIAAYQVFCSIERWV
jgi:hypothetical protein